MTEELPKFKNMPLRVSDVLHRKVSSILRSRSETVEERLQQKAHEFAVRNTLGSGAAYLQMRAVLEDDIESRLRDVWAEVSSILDGTNSQLTNPLVDELKALLQQVSADTVEQLDAKLGYIVKATGATNPEPLQPVADRALGDIEADVDLAALRDANAKQPETHDSFARLRDRLESACGLLFPQALPKLVSIQAQLRASNPEEWANAVHSCRRLLEDLADEVFPARNETRTAEVDGKSIEIKLGQSNYINRLIAFIQDNSDSGRFIEIVGSDMRFLGDRFDALFQAVQKGSHAVIRSRVEADRYVNHTLMAASDILLLLEKKKVSSE